MRTFDDNESESETHSESDVDFKNCGQKEERDLAGKTDDRLI